MTKTLPIAEARRRLTRLPDELGKDPSRTVMITRRGKPVLAVLNWDLYESIIETMEILGDEKLMAALRQSLREIAEGKLIPIEQVKRRLSR